MRMLAYASLRGMAMLGLGQRIGGNGGGSYACRSGSAFLFVRSARLCILLPQTINLPELSIPKALRHVDTSWNIWKGHKGAEVFHQV
jgi:hypothetical protein